MGPECDLSFADLFRAVHRRAWTAHEKQTFETLSQPGRNAWVKQLARSTGGTIATEDRLGTDGKVYTAFWEATHHRRVNSATERRGRVTE